METACSWLFSGRRQTQAVTGPNFNQKKDYLTMLYYLERELRPTSAFCPCVIMGRRAGFFRLLGESDGDYASTTSHLRSPAVGVVRNNMDEAGRDSRVAENRRLGMSV
jgi:hypothetical protein